MFPCVTATVVPLSITARTAAQSPLAPRHMASNSNKQASYEVPSQNSDPNPHTDTYTALDTLSSAVV